MKIRTQFYLLIAGIIIIPFLIGGVFFLLQKRNEVQVQPVPGYEDIVRATGKPINREAWEEISAFLSRRPPWADFIITDAEQRIVFSTLFYFRPGMILSDGMLTDYIRENSHHYLFQIDAPTRLSDDGLLVITQISRERKRPPNPFERIVQYVAIILLTLLVFSITMSIIIANSITKSVLVLEETTRRIAAGELDLQVQARGSNEITSLTSSLNRMRLALKEEEIRRARFIMGVSHDLKTPLALIKGYAEAIGDGITDDPTSRNRSIEIILSKVEQLEGMINELIDFVRMDTNEWQHHLSEVPLVPFLQTFCNRVMGDAELLHRQVTFSIELPPAIQVKMNEALITRALENLVNNALRYTSPGGLVHISAILTHSDTEEQDRSPHEVSTGNRNPKQSTLRFRNQRVKFSEFQEQKKEQPSRILIQVTDNGIGIDEEDLPRIFDLFYRGTNSRREAGMGIGLAVVKSILDSHGWTISVHSQKNKGSVFTIFIPLSADSLVY
ncbi:HAMP domain-containing sensor histidine kinase [Treponema sp. J25]|uniref:sensor histidine kinase n=1 Tax=Treponema sp. J25 TaxID=2094121 RepID=UPI0010453590|nr:HAMP domain-containing sensor histidine kinase [Treponema sp. J25]TCW60482.1 hypothetical protein C5O22_11415 [Treponema sp. J25]